MKIMKNFSTLITEANITIPQFNHKDLNNPRDPEGKFWKALSTANEETDKASKNTYDKAIKMAKDLYSLLTGMIGDDDIEAAKKHASDIVKHLENSSAGALEETSVGDQKFLRNCVHVIQTADDILSHKRFYKDAEVDVKAGYVPFKGAAKDPKIKYRMVVRCKNPINDIKVVKAIVSATPITKDYIAGIEWNKDRTAFAILITNSPGYRR